MQEYKKGVRLLAERYGATIDYANDAGLTLIASDGTICFTPISKNAKDNAKASRKSPWWKFWSRGARDTGD